MGWPRLLEKTKECETTAWRLDEEEQVDYLVLEKAYLPKGNEPYSETTKFSLTEVPEILMIVENTLIDKYSKEKSRTYRSELTSNRFT